MRQIEKEMISAVKTATNFSSGNTVVTYDANYSASNVLLHGHHIATYRHNSGELMFCLCGYPTALTRSRITALCNALIGKRAGVYQQNGVQYALSYAGTINGMPKHTRVRVPHNMALTYYDDGSIVEIDLPILEAGK